MIDLVLPEALRERLERVSRIALPWPYEMLSSSAQKGFTYGGYLDRIDTTRPLPLRADATGPKSYRADGD